MSVDEIETGSKVTVDYPALKASLDAAASLAVQIQAKSRNHEQEILATRLSMAIERAQATLGEATV